MFYGIRARLVGTYLLIIILTVVFCEAIIMWSVNTYYLDSISSILKRQSETASNFYSGYLSNTDIESNSGKLLDNFSKLPVQIQVIDNKGIVIADSLHITYGMELKYPDIMGALKGNQGKFMGEDVQTKERVLSYSAPLRSGVVVVGAVRFTTSLELTYKTVGTIYLYLIIAGIIIILLIFLISLYISHTITNPIKKITRISNEMAKGNLSVRAEKIYNDEVGILAESLNHMADEIEKSEKLKNEFISSISHELRTPLTSIKGWTVTLMDTKPEEFDIITRGTNIINSETDRLSEMVDELLDFSRLQSGKFSLHFEEVEINDLIRGIFEQMVQRSIRLGIDMKLNLQNEEQHLMLDSNRIKQVMINLLDNALKFTTSGGFITISTRVDVVDQAKYYVVMIEDTGCGINENELPLIRNKFYRGQNSSNISGLGLGMSICYELVIAHGGILEIGSQEEQGTTVVFKLPFKG
ncbi:MAG: histidine kinase [Clostridiales bacterium]|nr:histidine kinase [Clostridiales bacterium]